LTFFVCICLLLRFLIQDSFIVYVKDSGNKDADNSSEKKSGESQFKERTAPQHLLDLEEKHDKEHQEQKKHLER
jgi:hypothetical protein